MRPWTWRIKGFEEERDGNLSVALENEEKATYGHGCGWAEMAVTFSWFFPDLKKWQIGDDFALYRSVQNICMEKDLR